MLAAYYCSQGKAGCFLKEEEEKEDLKKGNFYFLKKQSS